MKFTDEELESLYLYGKLLLAKLRTPATESGAIDLGDTALEFVGHSAGTVTSGSPAPGQSDGRIESFTGVGRGSSLEEALMIKLSELIQTFNAPYGIDMSQAESLLIYVGVPSTLSDDADVQQRAADNTEEQFSLTIKKDDIAGALFTNQESSNKLLKALLENDDFADAVQKIVSSETWKAARRKHAETAA